MSSALLDKLLADIKAAMKAKESEKLVTLRSLHAQIKDVTTNAGKEPSDELVAGAVAKAIKQRRDAIEQYRQGGRMDLVDKEQREIKWIEGYQPRQLGESEIEELARAAIAESGASGRQDMGKVMKALMPNVKGRADGKIVTAIVQRLLARIIHEPS